MAGFTLEPGALEDARLEPRHVKGSGAYRDETEED